MKKTIFLVFILMIFVFNPLVLAEEEVEITMAVGTVGIEQELAQRAAEIFEEENPGVKVNIQAAPETSDERRSVFLQHLDRESPDIDVYQIDVIWPGEFSHFLVDLNEYGADDIADQHFDAMIENNTIDGKLVAIPWFTDAGLLYYRTDLLEEYGFSAPPETWDELEEMAEVIQAGEREDNPDFWGYVWQGYDYEGLTCNALEWIHSHAGGRIINEDGEITVNNEQAIKAVSRAADWIGEISPPETTGLVEESSRVIFEAGNAAFLRNWPYVYALASEEEKAVAGKFDLAPLPASDEGESSAALGGWNLAVSRFSENKELAAELALFMASPRIQKMRAVEGAFNPTIEELYEDEEVLAANPFFEDLYEVFENAVPRPSSQTGELYNEVSSFISENIYLALNGDIGARTSLEYLEIDLEDLLGFETRAIE
ncbi:ABC transporter substrate-binding protein [Halanaerobium hydrogeniformans]|uniref:Extracellular solute-binding protein family 1 n=1 Tax=Halanaerobium hydrogeniformans TaxID=656519 RepID=E4RK22_HALHG|nr:ABC transporter substrate-binding protein [Halanaerobium hydrogeniformans]ADQ15592.1 extracellular solute-binding protein family 1 [Halanaerobium hydrogeniformans]